MKLKLLILILPLMLFAHPHIFVDVKLNIQDTEEGISRIGVTWIYDEMTSQMISMDYDRNMNGRFDDDEFFDLKKNTFDNLLMDDYYVNLFIDEKNTVVRDVISGFNAKIIEDKLIYTFNIDKVIKLNEASSFQLGFNDPTYYTAFMLKKSDVKITANEQKLKLKVETEQSNRFVGEILTVKR